MVCFSNGGNFVGGVAALAGALVGDDADVRQDAGDFAGTPILLACGDNDDHIPEAKVRKAATMLAAQGRDNTRLIVALAALDGIEAAEQEIERQPARDQKTLWAVLRHNTAGDKVSCPGFTG